MKIDWIAVARDAILVYLLRFLGGLVVSAVIGTGDEVAAARNWWDVGLMAVGFCIVACVTRTHRFRHLVPVALAVWLLAGIDLYRSGAGSIATWLVYLVWTPLAMLVGGGASFLIVRERSTEPPSATS
jgi:hypothetical protein